MKSFATTSTNRCILTNGRSVYVKFYPRYWALTFQCVPLHALNRFGIRNAILHCAYIWWKLWHCGFSSWSKWGRDDFAGTLRSRVVAEGRTFRMTCVMAVQLREELGRHWGTFGKRWRVHLGPVVSLVDWPSRIGLYQPEKSGSSSYKSKAGFWCDQPCVEEEEDGFVWGTLRGRWAREGDRQGTRSYRFVRNSVGRDPLLRCLFRIEESGKSWYEKFATLYAFNSTHLQHSFHKISHSFCFGISDV